MSQFAQRIALLTCGYDCPGMNACLRAVVRMAVSLGIEPWGIREGLAGLVRGESVLLNSRSVSDIVGRGGTFLGASRANLLIEDRNLRDALRHLHEIGAGALVLVGDRLAVEAGHALEQAGFPSVVVPASIQNDICGTDLAVGVDTALNTALEAIDRIKDTASSQQQAFLVQVMGDRSGYLALMVGIAGGAEMIFIPETPVELSGVARQVRDAYVRGKRHCIMVAAEGIQPSAQEIAQYLNDRKDDIGFVTYLSLLGHIQRGGAPSARDRLLATQLGAEAVRRLQAGDHGIVFGLVDGALCSTPLADVIGRVRPIDAADLEMAKALTR